MSIRLFALCSALLMTAAPAGAQQFNDWMTPRPGYTVGSGDESAQYGDARRIAYDNGYRKGVERGENAVRDRRALDLEREKRLSQRRQRLQPELRRQEPLSQHVPQRLCRRLPDGLQPLWLQRRLLEWAVLRRKCRAAPRHRLGLSPLSWGESGIRQRVGVRLGVTRSRTA